MNKQILRLAIPSILANITIPLVGLVDTAIVGHISDAHAIGGIAIGTMLFDLLYWNFGFLRVGTSGMTAQAYGRDDRVECARLLTHSVTIALLGAALIWLLQWLFVTAALAIIPCSTEVAVFARQYFFIRVWAAPATLSLMAIKGWFIGMQDTVSPMMTDMVVNIVNMAVSYVLAVYTPMGALGVALGTVVAQLTGLLLAIVIICWKYRDVWKGLSIWQLARDKQGIRSLITLNANLFVRSLCFMIVYVGFTSLSSMYGDTDLAVCSILMKLFMLVSYFVDGFAYAGEALVGKYIGEAKSPISNSPSPIANSPSPIANSPSPIANIPSPIANSPSPIANSPSPIANSPSPIANRPSPLTSNLSPLTSIVRLLFLWSLGVGVVFTVIFALSYMPMYRMMTSDASVLERLTDFNAWLIAMPIVSTLAFMWDGVFTGATAGKQIRNAMIWAAVGFVLGYVATAHWCGVHALFVGYFLHLAARVIYLTATWKPLSSHLYPISNSQ